MNQENSIESGKSIFEEYPQEACLSRGLPGADEKRLLFDLFIRTQRQAPELRWAFEIQQTTALHEIIDNPTNNIFLPSQGYWLNRILKEGGYKVINWARKLDGATPLHLAKTACMVEVLLREGADSSCLNRVKKNPLEKMMLSPRIHLEERCSIYRLFLKYSPKTIKCNTIEPWNLNELEIGLISRVEKQIEKDKQKWSFLLLNFDDSQSDCPFTWLPKELRILIAIEGFFH